MLADQIDNGGADDDAIGDPRDGACLFGRAHAKADRDGKVGRGLQAVHRVLDRTDRGGLLAGDPGDRDVVEEA
jgi:hypothetical protein